MNSEKYCFQFIQNGVSDNITNKSSTLQSLTITKTRRNNIIKLISRKMYAVIPNMMYKTRNKCIFFKIIVAKVYIIDNCSEFFFQN